MNSIKSLTLALSFLFIVVFVSSWKLTSKVKWAYSPINELVVTDNYSSDLGLLFMGAHRLAADIAYIQFLQYYGVDEVDDHEEKKGPHFHDETAGRYPRLYELGLRILRLDPYFNAANLEVAGSLAFNQKRVDQALLLLREAVQRDPSFYRYRLYIAAILYKNAGQDMSLMRVLDEAVEYSDCPPLLQNVLANLHKKYGHFETAAYIYLRLIEKGPAETDRDQAKRNLVELVQRHPNLASTLRSRLPN